MHVVVVGGGAAGTTAALEIRKRVRDAHITIIEAQPYSEYSSCALPFVVDGTIRDFGDIIIHKPSFFSSIAKIDLMLDTNASGISTDLHIVETDKGPVRYDALVVATGSFAFVPPICGLRAVEYGKRTFLMKTISDASAIRDACATAESALVIGAGLVGMETAVALHDRGLDVTVMEGLSSILPQMLDPDMAEIVEGHLAEKGIKFRLTTPVESYEETGDGIIVDAGSGPEHYGICVVACGVRAQTSLAERAGIAVEGGILVDEHLRTNVPDVYACGDCVVSRCAVTGANVLNQLGSTAVRQAKVLAATVAGVHASMPHTFNTAITHLGGIDIGVVGITAPQADRAGIATRSSRFKGSTLPEYYPGGKDLIIRLLHTAEGRIIGGQVIGTFGVLARINMLSYAMQLGAGLDALASMETAYTPPLSPTVDPLTLAAEMALRKLGRGNRK